MATYRPRAATLDIVQFTRGVDLSSIAAFCGDKCFRVFPENGGQWVPKFRSGPGREWQPIPYGSWLLRLPDGSVFAAPQALSGLLAGLFEEVG